MRNNNKFMETVTSK